MARTVDMDLAYHDPCYLGRTNGEYDAPRELLGAIPGLTVREADLSRERSMCCGAGGGRMWMEENLGNRINQMRLEQLTETGAKVLSTACPFCMTMIADGIKETGREEQMTVKDIAEMVVDALPAETSEGGEG